MEGTLARQAKCDPDGFACTVAPQYWTWGNQMNGRSGSSLLLFI